MVSAKPLTGLTLRGLAWSGTAQVLQVALNIGSLSVLARILTPHDYGIMAGALVAVSFGTILAGLGLAPALIQRAELKPEHVASATMLSIAIAVVLGAALWASAPLVAEAMRIPELTEVCRVLSGVMAFQAFAMVAEAMLSRHMRFRAIALIKLCSWIATTFLVAIPLAVAGFGYWALVIASVAQAVVTAAAFAPFAWRLLPRPRLTRQSLRDLLPTSVGFSVSRLLSYVASQADNAIVARVMGPVELGVYSRSFLLISMPADHFSRVTHTVVFPVMSQIQDDKSRLRTAFMRGLTLTAMVAIPGSAFLVTFAGELVTTILGSQWEMAVGPFVVFSLAIYFRVAYKACALVLQARGRSYVMSLVQGIYAALVVIGALIAAPHGLVPVCVASSLAIVAVYGCYAVLGAREAGVSGREFVGAHVKPLLIALGLVAAGFGVKALMADFPDPVVVGVAAALSAVLLSILFYAWPQALLGLHREDIVSLLLRRPSRA